MATTERVDAGPRGYLAADWWTVATAGKLSDRFDLFNRDAMTKLRRILDAVVLYDRVIIPTDDFFSLVVLVEHIGDHALIELLDSEIISFVRLVGGLAYAGNGIGLSSFQVKDRDNGFSSPISSPIEAAVQTTLSFVSRRDGRPIDAGLAPRVASRSATLQLSTIMDAVRAETYGDVRGSNELQSLFGIASTDLCRLQGVRPDQMRLYGGLQSPSGHRDAIDCVLALAVSNIELQLSAIVGCTDGATTSPIAHALRAKVRSSAVVSGDEAARAFTQLCDISDIPDIAFAWKHGGLKMRDLLRIRERREGESFRSWFHEECRTDPKGGGHAYASLLRSVPLLDTLPVRLVRWIAASGLGFVPLIGPGLGVAAGALDTFVVPAKSKRAQIKWFIDGFASLADRRST